MIVAPTSCFFLVKAQGEAAVQVVSSISPGAANDIESVILLSSDFKSDIDAANKMHASIDSISKQSLIPEHLLQTTEQYNPLYIPSEPSAVDEMLQLDARTDGIKFTGMHGNPFTFKTVEILQNFSPVIQGKIEYHPFDLPSYSEIIQEDINRIN